MLSADANGILNSPQILYMLCNVVWNNIVCLPKVKLYVPVSR